jgi:hypothetical protein
MAFLAGLWAFIGGGSQSQKAEVRSQKVLFFVISNLRLSACICG